MGHFASGEKRGEMGWKKRDGRDGRMTPPPRIKFLVTALLSRAAAAAAHDDDDDDDDKDDDAVICAYRSFIMADRRLQIERVQISDEGVYVCRVENSVGWREAEARLVVHCTKTILHLRIYGLTVFYRNYPGLAPPPRLFLDMAIFRSCL